MEAVDKNGCLFGLNTKVLHNCSKWKLLIRMAVVWVKQQGYAELQLVEDVD